MTDIATLDIVVRSIRAEGSLWRVDVDGDGIMYVNNDTINAIRWQYQRALNPPLPRPPIRATIIVHERY